MKTILKFVLVIAIVALCSNVSAQTLKLAHINMQELIVSMSEYDTAMVKMQKVAKDLETELETLNVERNKKLEEYANNNKNWTDLVRQSREQELQAMSNRIQMFQEQAQESYQQENEKLMQPILEKANKAIEIVAKEQGIIYVLSSQALLYKAIDSVDLLPAVKQHMGIKK
jgi:outer membrane protein